MGTEEYDETMEEEEFQGFPNEGVAPETEPEPEAEEPETEQPQVPTPEQLQKKEHDLQKGFEEVARRKKELDEIQSRLAAGAIEEDEDLEPEAAEDLTPEAREILKRFVSNEFGPVFNTVETMYAEMVNSELSRFASEKGVDEATLVETIRDNGLFPKDYSLASAKEVYERAYALHRAENFDEKTLEERIREKVLSELAEQGVRVEGVSPKASTPPEPEASGESVYDMTPDERLKHLQRKHPDWSW